ncbi:MAG: hypothetical protein ACK4VO_08085 [Pseudobdellovibrio sp.]
MKIFFKKSSLLILFGLFTKSIVYADPSGGSPYFKQEIRDSIKVFSQCQNSDRYEEVLVNKYGYQHVFIGLDKKPGLVPTNLKVVMAISNIEPLDIQKIKEFNAWNSFVCSSVNIHEKLKPTSEIIKYSKEFFGSTYEYTVIDYNPLKDGIGEGKLAFQKQLTDVMAKYLNIYRQAKSKGYFWINTDGNILNLNNPYASIED